MVKSVLPVVTLLALLGCGVMSGIFVAFSTSVMPAMRLLPPADGLTAMQQMNRTIQNPLFLLIFMGTALLCAFLAIAAPLGGVPGSGWIITGAVLYLVGSIAVTFVVNIPLNNAIDAADPASAEGAQVWADFLARWTPWNHLRGLTCTAATAALAIGLWR